MAGGQDEEIQTYLEGLLQSVPHDRFYIERRFISDEKWQKYAGDRSFRYSGLLREYEPSLNQLLQNRRLMIVGGPGAGKSTVARAIIHQLATASAHTDVPVLINLRAYAGDLAAVLAASAPNAVLMSRAIKRRYVFDGLDEVPREQLSNAAAQINDLLATELDSGLVVTARQAFYAAHQRKFGMKVAAFHLLDFEEEDLREYARLRMLEPQSYIDLVREASLMEEVRNPFNAAIAAERLLPGQQLSPIRSENVAWMVSRVLDSRSTLNLMRQRRAVRFLAVGMETYSRNELSREEATRILSSLLDVVPDKATEILDELYHSILTRTSTGVAFQLRSYGELLAAEALQDQPLDRVRQLAFFDDGTPNPSWMNTISFLVEQNTQVRKFFIANYPEWMLEASPAAFDDDERAMVAESVITALDSQGQFVLHHPTIKAWRLFRFIGERTKGWLLRDLDSSRPEVKANAMVVLGMAEHPQVVDEALPIAPDTRRSDLVRYSAIVAIMNGGSSEHVDRILTVLDRSDVYYDTLIEAAVMLVSARELAKVLPSVFATNTLLSVAFARFNDLRVRPAVMSVLGYLAEHPHLMTETRAESYLSPIVSAVSDHWDNEVGTLVTQLLVAMDTKREFGHGHLKSKLVQAVNRAGGQRQVCSGLIAHFLSSGTAPVSVAQEIGEWMNISDADLMIEVGATDLMRRVLVYSSQGAVRECLASHLGHAITAQQAEAERYRIEETERAQEQASRLAIQQERVRSGSFEEALNALSSLGEGTWPEISSERRAWFAENVSRWLRDTDLNLAIVHQGDGSWTQPTFLEAILNLVLETVTGRDLSAYMPIPHNANIVDHLRERGRLGPSLYRKGFNEAAASYLTTTDIEGTDLAKILADVSARYSRLRTQGL